jgi:Predicted oxidoreductases (related to aryl-alcohol dehydrogenases)
VDFDVALEAVEKIRQTVPPGVSMANFALRWILQHEEVSCVIPGARKESQVIDNAHAADLPGLSRKQMETLTQIYQEHIRPQVHQRW